MLLPHKLGLEWWQTDDCQRRPPREIVTNSQVPYETINWRRREQFSTRNAPRMLNYKEQTRGDEKIYLREWDRIMLLSLLRGEIFHALKAGWDENEYSANRNDKIHRN